MEKINNLFDRRVDIVCDNYSSLFSKDDVLNLISGLRADVLAEVEESKPVTSISEIDFQEFRSHVVRDLERTMENGTIDLFDYDSAEFSISHNNQLQVENIDFNSHEVTDELENILLDQFQQYFGKFLNDKTE
jgi:hypothetical protein